MTTVKNKAIAAFNKAFDIPEGNANGNSSVYVRKALEDRYGFNDLFHHDFNGLRGNSNAFWEAVIKWCPISEKTKNELLGDLWEAEIDRLEAENYPCEGSDSDLDELNEIQCAVNKESQLMDSVTGDTVADQNEMEEAIADLIEWFQKIENITNIPIEKTPHWMKSWSTDDVIRNFHHCFENQVILVLKPCPEQCHSIAVEKLEGSDIDWGWELNIGAVLAEYPPLQVSTFAELEVGYIVDGMYGYIDNKIGYFPYLTEDDIKDMEKQEYPIQAPPCGGFMWDSTKNTLVDQDDYNDAQEMLNDFLELPLGEREQKILDDHYDLLGRLASTEIVNQPRTCENCKYFDSEDGCYVPNNHPKVDEIVTWLNWYEKLYEVPYNPALKCPGYEYCDHCDSEYKLPTGFNSRSDIDDFIAEDQTCPECGGDGEIREWSIDEDCYVLDICDNCDGQSEV